MRWIIQSYAGQGSDFWILQTIISTTNVASAPPTLNAASFEITNKYAHMHEVNTPFRTNDNRSYKESNY